MLAGAKSVAKDLLPSPVYRGARTVLRSFREAVDYTLAFAVAARFGLPEAVMYFGAFGNGGVGDDLLCTAVLREMRKRGKSDLWIISNHPEIFEGRSDASRVFPFDRSYKKFPRIWGREFRSLTYERRDPVADRSHAPARHIIAELCARAGITGSVSLRPYLNLEIAERAEGVWAKNYIAIQSSGLAARHPMLNKQWFPERFQTVIDALRCEHEFIQLGSANDPMLAHVRDLRGKTNLRQSAAILHNARMYVGGEGFLMHLARSVECPSVVIYGGRTAPWQTGYRCNDNLYTAVSCSPCWRWNTCHLDRKCMREIVVEDVVLAIREMISKPRGPLAVETAIIEEPHSGGLNAKQTIMSSFIA